MWKTQWYPNIFVYQKCPFKVKFHLLIPFYFYVQDTILIYRVGALFFWYRAPNHLHRARDTLHNSGCLQPSLEEFTIYSVQWPLVVAACCQYFIVWLYVGDLGLCIRRTVLWPLYAKKLFSPEYWTLFRLKTGGHSL